MQSNKKKHTNVRGGPHEKLMDKFKQTIEDHKMLACGDSVAIGVSGGPDSVALLLFLIEIQKEYSLRLGIVHINHCLRGKESDRDAEFVENLAFEHEIPFFLMTKKVALIAKERKLSVEEAAREVRYAFYKDVLTRHNYSKTALGHNCDDNAELVLMNLLRGSGPRGLSGIPPKRDGWIIRPLMQFSKQDILSYLEFKSQTYVIDSSNKDIKFLRNKIRSSLLPLLREEYNPAITDSLNRLSNIIRSEEEWMEKETELKFNRSVLKQKDTQIQLSTGILMNLHPALIRRIIRSTIKKIKGDLKRITLQHIDAAAILISSAVPGKSLDLPDRIRIIKQKDRIYFNKESQPLREIGKRKKDSLKKLKRCPDEKPYFR